jgi:hypothetical protein
MRSANWFVRLAFGLALVLGVMAMGMMASPASAQQAASASSAKLTIHKAVCPATTTNLFASCHENRLAGVGFTVAGVSRHTDANGVVSWGPTSGTYTIHEFSTDFTGKAYVFCKDQTTGTVWFDGRTTTGNISIPLAAGHTTICDWYNLT